MVLSLKAPRRFALGKGVEGEASEIRQLRDIGKRWEGMASTAKRCILCKSMIRHINIRCTH
jgi:hypothetical protein